MPHAAPKNSTLLAISLTEKQSFFPGETIIGTVSRKLHIVDTNTTVKLSFRGSSKVKITRGSGNQRSVYRRRVSFWTRDITQELHRGPVHVPQFSPEPASWSFAVTIPERADENLYRGSEDSEALYVQKTEEGAYDLPATFASGLNTSDEFYTEYVLTATLRDSKGHEEEAVLPIQIIRSCPPTPITNFNLKRTRSQWRSVSTFHLDPAYASAELSFKQKAKELFGSSQVPHLSFELHVSYPQILQIDHPEPAPFHIRASMREQATSEVIRGTTPAVIVTRFRVRLEEVTSGIAEGFWAPHEDENKLKFTLLEWRGRVPEQYRVSRTPSREPSPAPEAGPSSVDGQRDNGGPSVKAAEAAGKDSAAPPSYEEQMNEPMAPPPDANTLIVPWESAMLPLDLGQALELRVAETRKYSSEKISPSFKTMIIRTRHRLRWEIEFIVAGENVELEGSDFVEVMPRSADNTFRW